MKLLSIFDPLQSLIFYIEARFIFMRDSQKFLDVNLDLIPIDVNPYRLCMWIDLQNSIIIFAFVMDLL